MLLGFISLMLSQTARWISEICMPSSLFSSRFYTCSENDFEDLLSGDTESGLSNQTTLAKTFYGRSPPHQCSEVCDYVIAVNVLSFGKMKRVSLSVYPANQHI